jgi:hypothetical protein
LNGFEILAFIHLIDGQNFGIHFQAILGNRTATKLHKEFDEPAKDLSFRDLNGLSRNSFIAHEGAEISFWKM